MFEFGIRIYWTDYKQKYFCGRIETSIWMREIFVWSENDFKFDFWSLQITKSLCSPIFKKANLSKESVLLLASTKILFFLGANLRCGWPQLLFPFNESLCGESMLCVEEDSLPILLAVVSESKQSLKWYQQMRNQEPSRRRQRLASGILNFSGLSMDHIASKSTPKPLM